jgi:hypothetical protein
MNNLLTLRKSTTNIGYCKLEFLKVKTCLNHFALKYKLLGKANQMAFLELKKLQTEPMIA